jgi:hypothetical protein
MGMVEPSSVGREQEPTTWLQDAVTLAQIVIQVPNVLQYLERNDAIRGLIRKSERLAWLNDHVHVAVKVASDVLAIPPPENRLIRAVATTYIDDALALLG